MTDKVKILITGASGYIGSRACSYLSARGFDVVGLSRHGGGFIKGDFGDENRMLEIIGDTQPDVVLHCAGVTPHRDVSDRDYKHVNVDGGRALMNAIVDRDIKLINCSTIGVYGVPLHDGIVNEGDACKPLSPYAQSKYDFENNLSDSDVRHVNIRIANIPGRDAFINYVTDNKAVNFYGEVPYVRDYIHLDDLNVLFEKSIEYLVRDGEELTVNAGSGVGYSFPDIVDEIERQMADDISRNKLPSKQSDVVKIICDIQNAKNVLGWEPQQTGLKEIVDYALRNR